MQKFYIANNERRLYFYTHDDNKWEQHFINGEPFIKYSLQELNEKAAEIKEYLADEYNAESADDFEFRILADANESVTDAIMTAFVGEQTEDESLIREMREKYVLNINVPIKRAIDALSKNKELMIQEYGINYCGRWYYIKGNLINRSPNFSLTAYTLEIRELLKYIKEA